MEAQARQIEQLRAKLLAAETLCEELMDENEDMKKELRDLEEEIEEMQDNFRQIYFDLMILLLRYRKQTKHCPLINKYLTHSQLKIKIIINIIIVTVKSLGILSRTGWV